MTRKPALSLLVVLLVCTASAADIPRDVSSVLRPILAQSAVPGMVGAVVQDGRVTAVGAAGVRRKGSPSLMTVRDRVHIGSCAKAMTSTVVAMLVEEGKLSWDTTLAESFPELQDTMRPAWRNVTVGQLLNHCSGLPRDNGERLTGRLRDRGGPPSETRMALIREVLAREPVAEPGTTYLYSNSGFAIAGAIVERIEGRPWEDVIRARLFAPLGMDSAGFGSPGVPDQLDQPRGHDEDGKTYEPGDDADNPQAIAPAGTVHCSIEDWAKFVALHLQGENGNAKLLKPETFQRLHRPINELTPQYAFGWIITKRDWADGRTLTHNGTNTLWFAVVWMAPKKDLAVLVVCNQGGKEAAKTVDEAAWALIQEHLKFREGR